MSPLSSCPTYRDAHGDAPMARFALEKMISRRRSAPRNDAWYRGFGAKFPLQGANIFLMARKRAEIKWPLCEFTSGKRSRPLVIGVPCAYLSPTTARDGECCPRSGSRHADFPESIQLSTSLLASPPLFSPRQISGAREPSGIPARFGIESLSGRRSRLYVIPGIVFT